jgi:hypothetical protein
VPGKKHNDRQHATDREIIAAQKQIITHYSRENSSLKKQVAKLQLELHKKPSGLQRMVIAIDKTATPKAKE